MAKRIEIDGRPPQRPPYLKRSLSPNQYVEYLLNGADGRGFLGSWYGGSVKEVDEGLLRKIARDRDLVSYVASVVREGSKENYADQFASILADRLAHKGEILELEWRSKNGDKAREAFPAIGTFLERGTIVFRGDVKEVTALKGGTLYIDGNVEKISQPDNGIIYVRGDVGLLEKSDKAIIVVAGKVGRYVQTRKSWGGLNKEITPSPFIFTAHKLDVEIPDQWQGRDVEIPKKVTIELSPSHVVPEARLKNWLPEETKAKALDLCRERINAYLEDLKKVAGKITKVSDMKAFAVANIYGLIEGYSDGYYAGSASSSHSLRDD